ncbi:MAG: thiaminase II, partial [Chloroflexi bacterium]|nr:thiaminase II [Chloroflexota bacterium]
MRAAASAVWDAQAEHPFIRGIGDGSLDVERFKHWVRQDYLFLIDYARVLSLAASRAPDLEAMTRLAEPAHAPLATELPLHRAPAQEVGIA